MTPAVDHPHRPHAEAAAAAAAAAAERAQLLDEATEEIYNSIFRPGSVKINVKGAFIVDPDTSTPAAAARAQPNGQASPTHHETSDIRLPNHTAVVSHIAVDIGGSLIKLVYFSREVHSTDSGGRLNFQIFETDRIDDCVEFMKHLRDNQLELNGSQPGELCVMATGGGAYKFYDKIRDALGVDVLREDEMECLIIGLDFFITEIPREVFTYSETDPMHFVSPRERIYPYLLVNIGSGVSILKVDGPRSYQRVGGTSLGGGTLWGLLSLLTGARNFDDMLEAAGHGDNANVDMLVGDIYGADYGKIGLKSTTIASSFGKVFKEKNRVDAAVRRGARLGGNGNGNGNGNSSATEQTAAGEESESSSSVKLAFDECDISRSLLYAVSNNIGQIAYLQSQIHNVSDIYFGGSFIRGHRQTMNTLSYGLKFWSKGEKQAYFLRHEGYLGAVGAFLRRQPKNWGRRNSLEGLDEILELRRSLKANKESSSQAVATTTTTTTRTAAD
ncbi:pantothenate kinase [Moelleriella libera RCEF 2490]|uniref:Pantothenate kinase n=1 Tax=Moelleriella libera RCEF 2490 TaxID=1081109 RepID=A0A167ZZT3_9HYPO|nr:pantothenate kinase [Moelleriella libera RCEF 2490]